jgi:hypothetical protein
MNYLFAAGVIITFHATSLINGMYNQALCPSSSTQNVAHQAQNSAYQTQNSTYQIQPFTYPTQTPTFSAQQPTYQIQYPAYPAQTPVFSTQQNSTPLIQQPKNPLFPQMAYPYNQVQQQAFNQASLNKLAIIHQPSTIKQNNNAPTNPHLMPIYKSPEIIKNTTKQTSSNDQKKLMRKCYVNCQTHLYSLSVWRCLEKNSDSLCSLLNQVNTLKKEGITERMLCCFAYTYKPESLPENLNNTIKPKKCITIFERLRKYNKNLTKKNLTSPSKEQINAYKNNINTAKNDDGAYRAFHNQQMNDYRNAILAHNHGLSNKTFSKNPYSDPLDWVMYEFHLLTNHIQWLLTPNDPSDIKSLAQKIYDKHAKKVDINK